MRSSLTKTRNAGPTSTSKASAAARALRSDARTPSRWFARVAKTRERLTCASRGMRSSARASGGVGASRPTGRSAGTRAMHAARRRARPREPGGRTRGGTRAWRSRRRRAGTNARARPRSSRGEGAGGTPGRRAGASSTGIPGWGAHRRGGGAAPRRRVEVVLAVASVPRQREHRASATRAADRARRRVSEDHRGPRRGPATSVGAGNSSAEPADEVVAARAGSSEVNSHNCSDFARLKAPMTSRRAPCPTPSAAARLGRHAGVLRQRRGGG